MIDAVFISDLHLHPQEKAITERFNNFIKWAASNAKSVYILGDFFHAWAGDDGLDSWSEAVAKQLARLAAKGVKLYYLHGNRDFLLGKHFAQQASITLLNEPTLINLGGERVLLVHGDRYCTKDKAHQWLRRLTRNTIFPKLFLFLPYKLRANIVCKVRQHSQSNRSKPLEYMGIVTAVMLKHMRKWKARMVIHGHIHQPGLITHERQGIIYKQYVLSDWDDNPTFLCYDSANGFYFTRLVAESSDARCTANKE